MEIGLLGRLLTNKQAVRQANHAESITFMEEVVRRNGQTCTHKAQLSVDPVGIHVAHGFLHLPTVTKSWPLPFYLKLTI